MDISQLVNTFLLVNVNRNNQGIQDFSNLWLIFGVLCINYILKNYKYLYQSFINWFEANIYKRVNVRFQLKVPLCFVYGSTPSPYKSNKILGILYYLQTNKINAPEFEEINIPFMFEGEEEIETSYLLPILSHYKIIEDIYISINTEIENVNKFGKNSRENRRYDDERDQERTEKDMKIINLSLCSYKHDVSYINNFINKKEQIYLEYINKDTNKLKIFTTSSYYDHDIGNQALRFNKYYLSTNKSFNTLFFEGKEQIITRLDRYNKNISEYKRLGVPHTLGFLFHGIPGSGKTSTIKAIANYTNRSIISVNMNHINCVEDMIKLFNNEMVTFSKIPLNKRMYVFEEIDCYDYFLSREFIKEEQKEETKIEDVLTDIVNNKKRHNKKKKDENKITIGQILEVLDGIIECEDRIIIFTTNHVEKIDKALIRPGRIDMITEFKKLRKQDIQDLFKLWFNRDIPEKDLKLIKDYCVSQADFGKLCFEHMNQPMKIVAYLIRL
jgi:hypothetical protein